MADTPPTRDELLARLQAGALDERVIIPEVPYVPPSPQLLAQVPELGRWYSQFNEAMQRWREMMNQELNR